MASNTDELTALYQEISVLEMVENLKDGGVVWNKVNPYQYSASVEQNGDLWDLYLTNMPNVDGVILDFRKNASFFYSVNSSDQPYLENLFAELDAGDDLDKDKDITSALQQAQSPS